MLNFLIDLVNIWNDNESGAASSDELDTSTLLGNLFLCVHTRAGGTGDATVTVEHSLVSGSGFAVIPASALFNLDTGEADTFSNRLTLEIEETLGLNRQQLQRYLRVTIAGTLDQDLAVSVGAARQATASYS